jgi:hypothetical protein
MHNAETATSRGQEDFLTTVGVSEPSAPFPFALVGNKCDQEDKRVRCPSSLQMVCR